MCFWVVLSCSVFVQKPFKTFKKPTKPKNLFLNLRFSSRGVIPSAEVQYRCRMRLQALLVVRTPYADGLGGTVVECQQNRNPEEEKTTRRPSQSIYRAAFATPHRQTCVADVALSIVRMAQSRIPRTVHEIDL